MDFTLVGVFFIAFGATLLSTMSGGGANIIAMPLYLAMGIPFLLAVAIMQVAAAFWVLPAGKNYLRGRKIEWSFIFVYSLIGLIGAVLGVLFLTHIVQRTFEICFGIIIVLLVLWLALNKSFGLKKTRASTSKRRWALIAALPQGAYEIIFGSGNPIFFSIIGVKLRGYELTESLGYYYVFVFPWVVIGAAILIAQGHYDIPIMTTAVIGATTGGYLGSKFGRYKGNAFIKTMFCIIGLVLGIKLILGF